MNSTSKGVCCRIFKTELKSNLDVMATSRDRKMARSADIDDKFHFIMSCNY